MMDKKFKLKEEKIKILKENIDKHENFSRQMKQVVQLPISFYWYRYRPVGQIYEKENEFWWENNIYVNYKRSRNKFCRTSSQMIYLIDSNVSFSVFFFNENP